MPNADHSTVDQVVDLMATVVAAGEIGDLDDRVVGSLADLAQASTAFLYVSDPRLAQEHFAEVGLEETAAPVRSACDAWLDHLYDLPEDSGPETVTEGAFGSPIALHPLAADGRIVGLLGTAVDGAVLPEAGVWDRILGSLGRTIDRLAEGESTGRKLLHLNTYLTVSSMLAKPVDLSELLEIALFCSMEAVNAEASSILLLDESKENFEFYHVAGPATPLLGKTKFPATEGVAGRVLRTLEAEVVNEEEAEDRVYRAIDEETGFRTRNMIAVPLIAGEEHIGVLEVLNKADGGPFTADERMILTSVAEEIAFAIRNATLFDYVVNTYCRRRQGEHSCKGCERPLGSWTPCMRYREFLP